MASTSLQTTIPRTQLAKKYGPWAVITGASSGIGAEFARQLAVAGFSVVLVARRKDRLETLAESLKATCGVDAKVVAADLVKPGGVESVIRACKELQVGLLINNAGVELHGSFFHHRVADHRNCIELNVTALTELAHAFGRDFCAQQRGGILFVSSISAGGMPWLATYSATKAFVTTLALTLRNEFKPKGVEVMSLEPGLVVSEMTVPAGEDESEQSDWLMPTEVCVREALQMFGKRAVYTPGLKYSLLKGIFGLLPKTWGIWLLSQYYQSGMDPKLFEAHQEDGEDEK